MGLNLVLLSDSETEYPFTVGLTDSTTGSWYTPEQYNTDDWATAEDLISEHIGVDFLINAMVLSVKYSQPTREGDVVLMALWHGHIQDELRNARYVYKGYPNAQISALCEDPKNFPTGAWYHLKGSDPDTCRYLHVTVNNNQIYFSVYEHNRTTLVYQDYSGFFLGNFLSWGASLSKILITNWDNFKNAVNVNAARQYVMNCQVSMSDRRISGVVVDYVRYAVTKNNNGNWADVLYYLVQTGYEPEPEPTTDDDPYAGDDSPYDPAAPGGGDGDSDNPYDPGDDIEIPDDPPFSISDTGLMTVYTPDVTNLNLLAAFLWSSNFITSLVKDLYADPMDVIISLGVLPFSITPGGTKTIKVGDRDTGISSAYPRDKYVTIDCGTINLKTTIGAYIDYAPYTKGDLYIPFVGFVPLDVDAFMHNTIGIKYRVEICTGESIVYVTRGGKVWQTFACNLMTPIPLSSANYGQMWQTVIGATAALAGAGALGAAGMGAAAQAGEMAEGAQSISAQSGNAAKAASGIMSGSSTKPSIQKSNNVSVLAGIMANRKPFIQLHRPNLMLPSNQNKYQGYPSYIESALNALSGYTRVSSINLSVPSATAAELRMIDAILKSGFIIGSGNSISGSGIVLGANTSPTHQIKKNINVVDTLTGTFRDSVDILHPVVRIERDNPVGFNYVYISAFGRCYFVDDVTVVRKGILDLHLSIDVLETFATEILSNSAIVDKQEKTYNLYLNDDSIKIRQDPLITNFEFPSGLFGNNGYEYVLLVAGN